MIPTLRGASDEDAPLLDFEVFAYRNFLKTKFLLCDFEFSLYHAYHFINLKNNRCNDTFFFGMLSGWIRDEACEEWYLNSVDNKVELCNLKDKSNST
ncbi:hypothetical protein CIK97_04440 [Prevotella sp. P3-120]|nr:hypothetical protein CIK93_12275 [Prevotella sp. P3-92]OYP50942.1 hypothetical protein CIK97_04440 [Prevotella sp. P3-120]